MPWPGGVPPCGGLTPWPGAVPLWPGAVPLRPGVDAVRSRAALAATTGATFLFFACAPLFPCDAWVVFALCVDEGATQAPIVSPWRMCAGSALFETMIVTKGFFFECVW